MGTARVEKERIKDIPDEEPIFILRGQDVLAPAVIERWCKLAVESGVRSSKIAEARMIAHNMLTWIDRRLPD